MALVPLPGLTEIILQILSKRLKIVSSEPR